MLSNTHKEIKMKIGDKIKIDFFGVLAGATVTIPRWRDNSVDEFDAVLDKTVKFRNMDLNQDVEFIKGTRFRLDEIMMRQVIADG